MVVPSKIDDILAMMLKVLPSLGPSCIDIWHIKCYIISYILKRSCCSSVDLTKNGSPSTSWVVLRLSAAYVHGPSKQTVHHMIYECPGRCPSYNTSPNFTNPNCNSASLHTASYTTTCTLWQV